MLTENRVVLGGEPMRLALVPESGSAAARAKHARELCGRCGAIEPMEGLTAGGQRETRRRAAPCARHAIERRQSGDRIDRGREHLCVRLETDDAVPARLKECADDAGAARDVQDGGTVLEAGVREDPVDELARIARPVGSVVRDRAREALEGVGLALKPQGTGSGSARGAAEASRHQRRNERAQ